MNHPRTIAAGLIATAALAAVVTAGFTVGNAASDAASVSSSPLATITAEAPRERPRIDLDLPCCTADELAALDAQRATGTDVGMFTSSGAIDPNIARSTRATSSTPPPAPVVAPAPVVVEPAPAPECAPGEEHDGERCVAVQLPEERIGRQTDGPDDSVCTVVAVDPDVLECTPVEVTE